MNVEKSVSEKNVDIVNAFYKNNQTFVTKEELIEKGFDFSEWFSTSNLKHYFDNLENSFEYKDFKCGAYYIKTRDKNIEKPEQKARLFFQIIRLEFDRNTAEYKRAIKLLHDRKFADGTAYAYTIDMEMRDLALAKKYREKLNDINLQIENTLPHLKHLIESLKNTHNVFVDLYERLQSTSFEDERWI